MPECVVCLATYNVNDIDSSFLVHADNNWYNSKVFCSLKLDLYLILFRERPGVTGKKFMVVLDFKLADPKHTSSFRFTD